MPRSRRRNAHAREIAARSRAFQTLYSLHFTPSASPAQVREAIASLPDPRDSDSWEADGASPAREEKKERVPAGEPGHEDGEKADFALELVEGVWAHREDLDEVIARFSHKWRVDRLGRIEVTLLRLALFEMLYRPDVPPRVAVNEALELSARFADDKARRFINGVLDAAIKAVESGELPARA